MVRRTWLANTAAAGLLLSASCVGFIGGDGSSGDAPGAGDAGDAGDAAPGALPSGVVVQDAPMRRLTRFEYDNTVRDLLGDTTRPGATTFQADQRGLVFDNNAGLLHVDELTMDGYEKAADALATAALDPNGAERAKLVACDVAAQGTACVRATLAAFLPRAWRRPVAPAEVDALVAVASSAAAQGGDLDEGLRMALKAALLSPSFIFRVETDPPDAAGHAHPVDAYALASRLSYFLWGSMPDDALFARAADGSLLTPGALAAETARMLADPKASWLVDNFATEWFWTDRLDPASPIPVKPDTSVYPAWDDDLRAALVQETRTFARDFVLGDNDFLTIFDANYTYANARLAKFYGLSGVTGSAPQKVMLDPSTHRGGLLTQGSVAVVTSPTPTTRTSPTKRGKWVLLRLLCSPPADPPPNVPSLDAMDGGVGPDASIRDRLLAHASQEPCKSCHQTMDPIGFAFEHYDGIGAWRDAYPGGPIDATGKLPDGTSFDGVAELSQIVKKNPQVVDCVARTAMTYALGRDLNGSDKVAVDALVGAFGQSQRRMTALLTSLVASETFRMRVGAQ